jgi:hypothetical protein
VDSRGLLTTCMEGEVLPFRSADILLYAGRGGSAILFCGYFTIRQEGRFCHFVLRIFCYTSGGGVLPFCSADFLLYVGRVRFCHFVLRIFYYTPGGGGSAILFRGFFTIRREGEVLPFCFADILLYARRGGSAILFCEYFTIRQGEVPSAILFCEYFTICPEGRFCCFVTALYD